MRKLLIIFIVISSIGEKSKAQTWVTIPDANFVTYLQSIIPAAMNGNQMNTSSTLVTTTTHSITCSSRNISNLFGVQYFTSLTFLDCGQNYLTSLPALSNSLTYLTCTSQFNGTVSTLTSLPVLPNSLTTLNCSFNQLTSLPALPNSLTGLVCSGNSLMSLPALPNSLTILYCGYNSLTSLPTLPNSLIALYCFNNNITCFPTFPYSLTDTNYFSIDPNPYNCLPNYITAMSAADLAKPLCAAGNSNGCAVAGIKQVTGINEQVSVYPNPATDILNVSLQQAQGTNASLQITDMLGNTVKQSIIYNLTSIINVGDLSEGVYNLSIASSIGVANKRLVIVK